MEVAVAFLKECGERLRELSPKGLHTIFDMLRRILQEGELDKRVSLNYCIYKFYHEQNFK